MKKSRSSQGWSSTDIAEKYKSRLLHRLEHSIIGGLVPKKIRTFITQTFLLVLAEVLLKNNHDPS